MNDWYQPNNPKKKSRIILCVVAVFLLVMILTAAMLFFLVYSGKMTISVSSNNQKSTEQDYPDDFDDYLDSYYTTTESGKAEIDIEPYEGTIDYELELSNTSSGDLSLQELYNKCSPWIVSISASEDGETYAYWGSGIIISPDGLIVTNTHIVDGCKAAYVQLYDQTRYDVTFVAADSISDIALLKIEPDHELDCAEFADSGNIVVGDDVAAIGCPLGDTFRNTLTNGIISAIERDIPYNSHPMTLLQTNTALNNGNSGGALFNMSGEVIGITNMKMMSYYGTIEGIAFAIPSSTVKAIVDELVANGYVERTSIGITVGAIPENVLKHYNLPDGLYVSNVTKESGADKAGIKEGDIITEVEGKAVESLIDINVVKDKLNVGDEIHLTVYRNGDTVDMTVVLTTDQR